MRVIGLDIHRTFAEVMFLENGELVHGGRVELTHDAFSAFCRTLRHDDEAVVEATGNTISVVRLLEPYVAKVVIANPLQVRAIAEAKIKTDKIDAAVLAQLHASGFLPKVWRADEETLALRREVARRSQIVRQRTQLKNQVQSVLHAYLIPRYPGADLFGKKGRAWLKEQTLPADERLAIERRLRELDRLADDLAEIERELARVALKDESCKRLMTISGVNMAVAVGVQSAIGDIARFSSPQKPVSYFGLNPSVRQSGLAPAQHGRITKQGRAHARAMLVEAAWAAAKTPGPLRAFFLRVRARRGHQIAAVATARKLATIIWHMLTKKEDYAWTRPALNARKLRDLELKAGFPSEKSNKRGKSYEYNLRHVREQERRFVERSEKAYERFVKGWRPDGPKKRQSKGCADAANERAS